MLNFFGKLQRDIQKVTSPAPASTPAPREEREDKEIVYSKAIKAGKRMYYLDVKKDRRSDLFLSITESKRKSVTEEGQFIFEKHKIFLYKEDFEKFSNALKDTLNFIETGEYPEGYFDEPKHEDFDDDKSIDAWFDELDKDRKGGFSPPFSFYIANIL